jgi:hypothetical protein
VQTGESGFFDLSLNAVNETHVLECKQYVAPVVHVYKFANRRRPSHYRVQRHAETVMLNHAD